MNYEIRTNDHGLPWVVFIPTEERELHLHPIGDPRNPDAYEADLSDLGLSRARDIMGLVKSQHFSLWFPGVTAPDGTSYRVNFSPVT